MYANLELFIDGKWLGGNGMAAAIGPLDAARAEQHNGFICGQQTNANRAQ